MTHANFIDTREFDDTDIEIIEIGKKTVLGSPDYEVLVSNDDIPMFLLQIYLFDEADCFHQVKYSDNYVVVGCGEKVHLFDSNKKTTKSIKLNGYFGHLYPINDIESDYFEDSILVASGVDLALLLKDGSLNWQSNPLGIDGVVVNAIQSGEILGEGEYDPPGGWEAFKLDIKDGKNI